MKQRTKIKDIILTIILFPIALMVILWMLIITPFDYIKYKRSRYYKDTKEKYTWRCGDLFWVKFYDLIIKEKLPIEYYRCENVPITAYGYFVYNDILILNDYDPCFDEEKNIWTIEIEDEWVDIKDDVEAAIEGCNDLIGDNRCKKAVVLIDKDLFDEHPDVRYDNIDFLPKSQYFDAAALRDVVL